MMKDNFPWATGRTALVTGATSGFGHAVALRLLLAGARVIATGRRQDRLDELASDAKTQRLFTLVHDVSAKGSGEALLTALPQNFAAIDILFNNAGLALGVEPAQKASLDNWETMIETNVAGLVRVAHAVLPGMVERGRGHIINVSSVAASYPYPGETEFSQVRFAGDKDKAAAVYAGMQPLSAEDVADTVEAVLRLPEHLNVNTMEIMPVAQAFAPFAMARNA
jgi:3-hydroxy acid dehydrogenase/malonic semialdehyde reductase